MPKSLKRPKGKNNKKEKVSFQSPKGMHDILPDEQPWWDKIKKISQGIADFYNFSRIDTPILELAEIFEKSLGENTDIVEKQMFVLKTKGKDRLVLRPENTASIVRAYLQHNLNRLSLPAKFYYFGPMFRYEHPQAGRYRQFHQIGFEILGGEDDPVYDAQIVLVNCRLIEELKIKKIITQLNSIGCKNCRSNYRKKLQEYYRKFSGKICKDCQHRFNLNPLRLLDCKNPTCEIIKTEAPVILDYLCASCRNHFRSVLEYLDEINLPYTVTPHLVRGLDYYNRTVFEIITETSGVTLAGGGRYDYLGELLGGKKTKLMAVGGSLGVERLIETMKSQEIPGILKPKVKIFLVQIGKPAKKKAFYLIEMLRQAGIKVIESLAKESLKSQMKLADKEKVDLALILGQREVFEDSIIIRDMKNSCQETVPLTKIVEEVKKRIH